MFFARSGIGFDAAPVGLNAPPTTPSRHWRILPAALSCLALAVLLIGLVVPAAQAEQFEVHNFTAEANNVDGTLDTQAGDHPFSATTSFQLTGGDLKDTLTELPPGFIGNPQAVPQCPVSRLRDFSDPCPSDAQIGVALVDTSHAKGDLQPVYNLVPERGHPAEFGFLLGGGGNYAPAVLYPRLRTGGDYGVDVAAGGIAQGAEVRGVTVTLWGVPADPRHDAVRAHGCTNQGCEYPTSSGAPQLPFLTNPVDCQAGPLSTAFRLDAWQAPGRQLHPDGEEPESNLGLPDLSDPNWLSASATAPALTGCSSLAFAPTISLQPDTTTADSPTGLAVDLGVPQTNLPSQPATPELKDATVALPAGLAVSPSSADGLQGCTPAQIDLSGEAPAACPPASQIGTVTIHSPLLDHPLAGQVYLGTPECAPCSEADAASGKLLKLYIAVADPQTGVVVKLPGTVTADPSTGQLTASFKQNPQLPFGSLEVDFNSGPWAPLATPDTCGTYTTTTDLSAWSGGGANGTPDATPSSSFQVDSGPDGSACADTPAQRPFAPAFAAGTLDRVAGAHSPLTLRLTRGDGSQQFTSLDVTAPPGLAATLKGVPACSDAALAAAAAHGGQAELANPSCPAASQVGTVTVGAGPGSHPFYISGKAYLAGPYKGAPLSLAIVTPAVAGPFDLGTVVVRSAVQVDPVDAHIHVVSDQIPQILDGIPLDIRDIRVNVDRPNFTLNPTNCSPMSIFADAFGNSGALASPSNPFQVGACAALPFAPKLTAKVSGGTRRNQNPAFQATITYGFLNEANVAFASVALPHSEFLDQGHIRTVCTRVQFAAGNGNGEQCPPASIYGHATAVSNLLDQPLEGPVYLRSSSHNLPDLVAALKGPPSQPIAIDLDGRIDSVNGGIRTTFESVPDAQVSKFVLTMQGGKKGLLVNSENLCAKPHHLVAKITAQNGKTANQNPVLQNSCGSKSKSKRQASSTGRTR